MTPTLMPDTTLTSAELDELERDYATPVAPKCPVCGNVTTLQRATWSEVTFGCDVSPFDADHYERSRTTVSSGDKRVLRAISLARAGLEAGKAEESMREIGWLIELRGTTPQWWSLADTEGEGGYFTSDSTAALRFSRKQDAEAYIDSVGWTETFASEHVWTATPAIRALPLTGDKP